MVTNELQPGRILSWPEDTKETHEAMTETAIKINEKLASKGKRLEEVSHEEFDDIAHAVGLKRVSTHQN